jgi:DnaJ domain
MIAAEEVLQLLHTLAAHPVVPPMDRLPADDEALHTLLTELIGGERSRYAAECRRAAAEAGITLEELARRAEFLLACLILPQAGTYYELLGITPNASPEEIRQRWAVLIQRYHPDHLGRSDGWVADQARRLIEAYQTLKNPERRRCYDTALLRERATVTEGRRYWSARHSTRKAQPTRQRWMPLILLMIGLAGFTWVNLGRRSQPLPHAALPPQPKLLDAWQQGLLSPPPARPSSGHREPAAAEKAPDPEPAPMEVSEQSADSTPSWTWQAPPESEGEPSPDMPTHAVAPHEPSWPSVKAKVPRPLAMRDLASSDAVRVARLAPLPPPVAETYSPATESTQLALIPPVTVVRIPPDQAGTGAAPIEDEPLVLIETFRAAYEREDLATLMRLFAASPREGDTVGWEAVQALYARNFATLDQIHYELRRLEALTPATNESQVVRGWFRIRAVRRDDPTRLVDASGPVHWVLRREANALRIAEIHYELSRR